MRKNPTWQTLLEEQHVDGRVLESHQDHLRATRQGYAGLTGLVTATGAGGYAIVEWIGPNAPKTTYKVSYPERDLELVS